MQNLTRRKMRWSYGALNGAGDHIWWISNMHQLQAHYPEWSMRYDLDAILGEIFDAVGNGHRDREWCDADPSKCFTEWEHEGVSNMLSVVMPSHNEEGHFRGTVEGVVAALENAKIRYEILVINDNSTDQTEKIVRDLARANPAVRCVAATPQRLRARCAAWCCRFPGRCGGDFMADGSDAPADLRRLLPQAPGGL